MSSPRMPFVLTGATGTGKTAVALELAERLDGTVFCADARQLYRGLDIATGKPSAAERARVPHVGFDLLDPREPTSAGLYARTMGEAIGAHEASGRVPLLVGGSGLYLRALHTGLADVPPIAADVRSRVRARLAAQGPEALHVELGALDPVLAARLAPRDGQRIARGLEVVLGTGRPLTAWQESTGKEPPTWFWVALVRPRDEAQRELAARAHGFFAAGLVDEVRRLLAAGFPADAPAFDALGYREAIAVEAGMLRREDAVDLLSRHTIQYAKRQATWLRGEARRVDLSFRESGPHESPGQVAAELAARYHEAVARAGDPRPTVEGRVSN